MINRWIKFLAVTQLFTRMLSGDEGGELSLREKFPAASSEPSLISGKILLTEEADQTTLSPRAYASKFGMDRDL